MPTAIVPGVIIPGIIVPGVIIICVRIVPVAVIKVAVPVHYIPKQVIIQRVVKTTVMTETVKTACQVIILNGIIVSFGVRTVIVINISLLTTFGINHIDCVMNVDGRHIVQYNKKVYGSPQLNPVLTDLMTFRCSCPKSTSHFSAHRLSL